MALAETESEYTDKQVLAATRADMEFKSPLAVLRHHVENLLAGFSLAICTRNEGYLKELVGRVDVRLEGCPECSKCSSTPDRLISWFGHRAPLTRQIITNLTLQSAGDSVLYSAVYQDWEAAPQPRCIAIGTYRGCLKAGPQVWRWTEHAILDASGKPRCPHDSACPETSAALQQGSRDPLGSGVPVAAAPFSMA